MTDELTPIDNFRSVFGAKALGRLNCLAEQVYEWTTLKQAIIDRLIEDDDLFGGGGGSALVYPAKITAVQGAGIAATYNAVALNDASVVLTNQVPVNRPFGTADIIEGAVDDKCLICLLPANPGDTSTIGFLVQLTEKAKFTNCQQQQPPPGANAPVTPANIGAPPKLSISAMQEAGYSLNEQLDYLLSSVDLIAGLSKYKTGDQSLSTTTFTDDSILTVNLSANTTYRYRFVLFINNAGALEGFKVTLNGTVGVTSMKAQVYIYDDVSNTLAAFARITAFASSTGAGLSLGDNHAIIEGTIETSTAGTFKLQWAQNGGAGASATVMQRGSSMNVESF